MTRSGLCEKELMMVANSDMVRARLELVLPVAHLATVTLCEHPDVRALYPDLLRREHSTTRASPPSCAPPSRKRPAEPPAAIASPTSSPGTFDATPASSSTTTTGCST